ncbi:alpha-galactosidase [Bifidobacterium miconisargentati]|uniref:alpha-galactosidase n=1 Tax=Bifidobacterium miconisargentati TaxID=2834437 RepID=UPI001BDBD9F1|nr:alpha-galactosidase [Bifidobacterium miconisargentati]MBW3090555.1 alpha-galactosidase [Bifidobacterium miconisargentati]
MSTIERFEGAGSDGTAISVVYAEQRDANIAFALAFTGNQLPRLVHWGRPLADPKAAIALYDAVRPQRVSGVLDYTPWPSVLPTQAEGWMGASRINVARDGVELFCRFAVTDVAIDSHEDTGIKDATVPTVTVSAADEEQGVGLEWTAELLPGGLIRQQATVRNLKDGELAVNRLELGFALPANATEVLTTTGHHLRERQPQRRPLAVERIEKVSVVGRPDFDASLLLAAGEPGFGFERGDVYAVHVAWSGNSLLSAERTPYTQALIGGGEVLLSGEIALAKGESYATPWVFGAYGDGLNEVGTRFHSYVRSLHPELTAKPRPVMLNTWEAVFFDHNFDTLKALADKAAASGVERYVVDDGWFGSRRDDTSGLGDWQIAQDVWPDGPKSLKALADYVHAKGMEFGLWFEPEMINPDSNTYRAHPDWVLKPTENRMPMEGRHQQVLDLSNPDAYRYIYDSIDGLVNELGIDYIKWDHNKQVTEGISPYTGRPAVHSQTLAVYRIWHDLKAAHPGLEMESCSSGGGRMDLGILRYASRVWTSDCVDPVEREDTQRYTSLVVPPCMMGEHIGHSPAYATHRATSQEMRMAMAFFGHMGIEWNLLKEPDEALAKLGEWVTEYKKHREWFAQDTCMHADQCDPAVRVDGMVKPDKSAAIYRYTMLTTSSTYPTAPVHLPGLDPDANYRVYPLAVNLDLDASGANVGFSPLGWWNEQGIVLPGRALTTYGIRPPELNPAQAALFAAVKA